MTLNISSSSSSGFSSVQALQASRAFRKPVQQETEPGNLPNQFSLPEEPPSQTLESAGLQTTQTRARHAAQVSIEDIQAVAAKAGFVGVTPGQIERAYALGESLFVDYKV